MQQSYLTSGRACQHAPVPVLVGCSKAVLAGAAFLIAGACGKSTTATGGKVAALEVDPSKLALSPGTSSPLTARVRDESGAPLNVQVFWASEDDRIARVSSQGIVTAVAAGHTQVAASRSGLSAVVPVTVSLLPPTVLRVNPNAAQLQVGATRTLVAELFDSRGVKVSGHKVVWTSGSGSVAGVDSGGVVTGTAAGTSIITAAGAGLSGTAVVTVEAVPVAAVVVVPNSASVAVGRTVQLAATLSDVVGNILTGRAIAWTSSDNSRALVLATGLVTGVRKGTVTITASSGGKAGTATITVR